MSARSNILRAAAAVFVTSAALLGGAFVDSAVGTGRYSGATGDFLNSLGVKQAVRVANAAELAVHRWGGRVTRDGYAAAGDGGGATYIYSSSACSISGGDGGSQVPAPGGGCFQLDWSAQRIVPQIWGAKADGVTDNKPAFTKAITALASAGHGELYGPRGSAPYRLNSTVSQPYSDISIVFEPGAVVDRGFATGPLFLVGSFASTHYFTFNAHVENITCKQSVKAISGACVQFSKVRTGKVLNPRCLKAFYQCVAIDEGIFYEIANLQVDAEGQSAIAVGCNVTTPQGLAANVTIRGGQVAFQHRAAVELCNASGVTLNGGFNTDFNARGLWAHPNTGQAVNTIVAIDPFFDTSFSEGVLIDLSGGGSAYENHFAPSSWVVSCGDTAAIPPHNNVPPGGEALDAPFAGDPNAACIRVIASPTNTTSAQGSAFVDNRIFAQVFNAGGEGFRIEGGVYNDYGGVSTDNCTHLSDGTCAGFHALNGVSHWTWNGRAGGPTGLGRANEQAYGVRIANPSSDWFTIGGDLSGNAIAPLVGGDAALHASFEGMLPARTPTAYTPTVTSPAGPPTAYTATGRYLRKGALVSCEVHVAITTNGAAAGTLQVSLPIPAATGGTVNVIGRDNNGNAAIVGIIDNGSSSMTIVKLADNTYPGVNGAKLDLSFSYTVAQ